ncbi:ABC transporter permease [Ancylobacter amanitiformis]|uniref:Peptide/nickel transport system permease protein n=1 Tax=Ancylobacter amanitiformis TaxID=217069 RepID=A0ABU0LPM9_9HYPH|nr:ABC transporter permease [Ancylobacter amanitiformis]MDQ0510553.1 peptide/nickel transport system permease protein [Ancylobacter amanitiformis]
MAMLTDAATPNPTTEATASHEPRALARFATTLAHVLSTPLGAIGLALVLLIVLTALLAPTIAPYDPTAINVKNRLADPSLAHLLGTDQLGRDLFSRVILGTRTAMTVALTALATALALALPLGLVAGYGPRWLDGLMVLMFDSISSLPMIMLGLAVVVLIGPGLPTVILVIVLYCVPSYARLVRTQTLSLKSRDFIKAEQAMDAGTPRILFRHLLPNVIGPLLILACLDISTVITLEAGLSFLGLGVKPQIPSWGNILSDGFAVIRKSAVPVVAGGVPLVLATLGFTFFGEALRDALDPRLARERRP